MSDITRNAVQIFFQTSLAEVIRKLRATRSHNEEAVIDEFVRDTRKEVASPVMSVKIVAIQKAVYFHMLGYSASYANFNIVEAMADKVFVHKRVAYWAACVVFTPDTDVIPLTTALLRRDLHSANQYESGLALYYIASVCTTNLAKDLISDVVSLLNHPRSYIRKKAVLSLYKLFLQYPDCIRPTYPRLKEKLEDASELCDEDASVRGAVVCVLCELARRNPSNFLGLAVPFYALLSNVQSNWTLIKIIKVFGYFAAFEPRLSKKLVQPLTSLITASRAKSVQYECLLAVANGMGNVSSLTHLAAQQLQGFVNETDQNLKLLGLEAMSRLAATHPRLFHDQRDMILRCLDDADVMIRRKALVLARIIVTRKTLVSTVNYIIDHCQSEQKRRLRARQSAPMCGVRDSAAAAAASPPVLTAPDDVWINSVVRTVIEMAQTDDYSLMENFEWYIGVLIDLVFLDCEHFMHGELIERELVTILARVGTTRQFGVEQLAPLLSNETLLHDPSRHVHAPNSPGSRPQQSWLPSTQSQQQSQSSSAHSLTESSVRLLDSLRTSAHSSSSSSSTRVLAVRAAAFLCGEYPHWIVDKRAVLTQLLSHAMTALPAEVQLACLMAVSKIAAFVYRPCARHTAQHDGDTDATLAEDELTYDEVQRILGGADEAAREADAHLHSPPDTTAAAAAAAAAKTDVPARSGDALCGVDRFCHSLHPDVQERACMIRHQILSAPEAGAQVYRNELACVAAGAQEALDIPEDLNMDEPFCADVDRLLASHAHARSHTARVRRGGADDDDGDDDDGDDEDDDDEDENAERSCLSGSASEVSGESDEGDEGANFMQRYRREQQRRLEKERRKAVSVFYLRPQESLGAEGSSSAADANRETSLAPAGGADHRNNNNNNNNDDETDVMEDTHRRLPPRRGRAAVQHHKTFVINRDLRMPNKVKSVDSNNNSNTTTDEAKGSPPLRHSATAAAPSSSSHARHAATRLRRLMDDDDAEADDATRQLRRIDVTRALRAEEALPTPTPYAAPPSYSARASAHAGVRHTAHAMDSVGGGRRGGYALARTAGGAHDVVSVRPETPTSDRRVAAMTAEKESGVSAVSHAAVTLCDTSLVRVMLYVEGCRWTRTGVELRCRLHTMNLVSYASLQDIRVRLDAREDEEKGERAAASVRLRRRGDEKEKKKEKDVHDESAKHSSSASSSSRVGHNSHRGGHGSRQVQAHTTHGDASSAAVKRGMEETTTDTEMGQTSRKAAKVESTTEEDSVLIASTLGPLAVEQTEVVLQWSALSAAALAQPVPLQLHYRKDRRRRTTEMPFHVWYVYFTKLVACGGRDEGMPSHTFNAEVLTEGLRGASLVAGFVPCSRMSVLTSVTQMRRTLRLVTIDVYRDAMSLYGKLHTRRSTPHHAHVAVLLRETEQDKNRGVSVYVRCHHPAIAELLLNEIKMILSSNSSL